MHLQCSSSSLHLQANKHPEATRAWSNIKESHQNFRRIRNGNQKDNLIHQRCSSHGSLRQSFTQIRSQEFDSSSSCRHNQTSYSSDLLLHKVHGILLSAGDKALTSLSGHWWCRQLWADDVKQRRVGCKNNQGEFQIFINISWGTVKYFWRFHKHGTSKRF